MGKQACWIGLSNEHWRVASARQSARDSFGRDLPTARLEVPKMVRNRILYVKFGPTKAVNKLNVRVEAAGQTSDWPSDPTD